MRVIVAKAEHTRQLEIPMLGNISANIADMSSFMQSETTVDIMRYVVIFFVTALGLISVGLRRHHSQIYRVRDESNRQYISLKQFWPGLVSSEGERLGIEQIRYCWYGPDESYYMRPPSPTAIE